MKAVSNKKVIVVIVVALLGVAAGGGGTYAALKDKLQTNNSKAPASVEATKTAAKLEGNSIPQGTVSPTTINNKPDDYKDKEVKARGRLIKVADNKYILVGQEDKSPTSVSLDVDKNKVDVTQFIGGYSDPKLFQGGTDNKVVGAVTVSGTVTQGNPGLTLVATKVEL
jgi:predicted ribosomally synthesized peptide with SipW-like signal peptide